jgi:putative glutamine amidotransferase
MRRRPRILVTEHGPEQAAREEPAWATFDLYREAVRRGGGEPVAIDPTATAEARDASFAAMDGLLLTGGVDLDPALYGADSHPAVVIQAERDELERAAWSAARARGLPILGVCRGLQAINVFSGGSLVQHLDGHDSPTDAPEAHLLRLDPASRLSRILGGGEPLRTTTVNSYHHQGVRAADLAPQLVASGIAPHAGGDLIESLEAADPADWLIGVQCHPERPELIGPEFERLWEAFVEAAQVRSGR